MLANPTMLIHCKFVFAAASASLITSQMNQTISVKNKSITGEVKIDPLNYNLQIDPYQFQSNIVVFDLMKTMNRPVIVDGMDVMGYTVGAGVIATLCFYYKQHSLKRFFFSEARNDKRLLK